jgi:hypothetical protein
MIDTVSLPGPLKTNAPASLKADLLIVADDHQFALAGGRIHRGTAGERNQARDNERGLEGAK